MKSSVGFASGRLSFWRGVSTPTLLLLLWLILGLASSAQSAVAVRLEPGQDLKVQLMRLATENHWSAACIVTAVGSLQEVHLRFADAQQGTRLEGKFEIVSLVGIFSKDGGHFHLSVSDSQGRTTGGHLLEGCQIYTTAEIVILPLPNYEFSRVLDPRTGYPELRPLLVEPVPGP